MENPLVRRQLSHIWDVQSCWNCGIKSRFPIPQNHSEPIIIGFSTLISRETGIPCGKFCFTKDITCRTQRATCLACLVWLMTATWQIAGPTSLLGRRGRMGRDIFFVSNHILVCSSSVKSGLLGTSYSWSPRRFLGRQDYVPFYICSISCYVSCPDVNSRCHCSWLLSTWLTFNNAVVGCGILREASFCTWPAGVLQFIIGSLLNKWSICTCVLTDLWLCTLPVAHFNFHIRWLQFLLIDAKREWALKQSACNNTTLLVLCFP